MTEFVNNQRVKALSFGEASHGEIIAIDLDTNSAWVRIEGLPSNPLTVRLEHLEALPEPAFEAGKTYRFRTSGEVFRVDHIQLEGGEPMVAVGVKHPGDPDEYWDFEYCEHSEKWTHL